jgi:carboxymethylenebutenolidase
MMTVRWDSIAVDGKAMRAYVGVPEEARCAGVLVAHHGPGLDGFVQDAVHRLFRAGYAVAAPDLYHRQPDDGADAQARSVRLRDDEVVADMNAAHSHLKALEGCAVGAVGVVGFCMGGRVAYLMAAASRELDACAVFYGGNLKEVRGAPPSPFERTADIGCPLIGFFGEDDTNPSPADVDAIGAELARHGKVHELHRYRGAGHAFLNFLAPRYRARAARGAWAELLAFFGHHLRA